jgi:hypothetical protein
MAMAINTKKSIEKKKKKNFGINISNLPAG